MSRKALEAALAGRLDTPEAREVREAFQAGRPLCLLPYPYNGERDERFAAFVAVLRKLGERRYGLGEPPYPFSAPPAHSFADSLTHA